MSSFKNTFTDNRQSTMKKIDAMVEPGIIVKTNSDKSIFDNENTSEMVMEVIVWLTVVALVIFSM